MQYNHGILLYSSISVYNFSLNSFFAVRTDFFLRDLLYCYWQIIILLYTFFEPTLLSLKHTLLFHNVRYSFYFRIFHYFPFPLLIFWEEQNHLDKSEKHYSSCHGCVYLQVSDIENYNMIRSLSKTQSECDVQVTQKLKSVLYFAIPGFLRHIQQKHSHAQRK